MTGASNVNGRWEGRSSWSINKLTKIQTTLFHDFWLSTRPDFITSILKTKCKYSLEMCSSTSLSKFPLIPSVHKVMATVFWHAEGTVLTDYREHSSTIRGTYKELTWSKKLGQHWRKIDTKVVWQSAGSPGQCTCSDVISKYDGRALWLTVSLYERFERPSYSE